MDVEVVGLLDAAHDLKKEKNVSGGAGVPKARRGGGRAAREPGGMPRRRLLRQCFSPTPGSMAKELADSLNKKEGCPLAAQRVDGSRVAVARRLRAEGPWQEGASWLVEMDRSMVKKRGGQLFRGAHLVPVYTPEDCPADVRATLMEHTERLFGRPPPVIVWG